jgi:subtilisin family serine protease
MRAGALKHYRTRQRPLRDHRWRAGWAAHPGYWSDDTLAGWSATGPTLDGFAKPDLLAPGMNIVSFMYNDHGDMANSSLLVQEHPDYSETSNLFRMNGTSMATAVTSGAVALLLQAASRT